MVLNKVAIRHSFQHSTNLEDNELVVLLVQLLYANLCAIWDTQMFVHSNADIWRRSCQELLK